MTPQVWRLIDTGPQDAFWNMALDEALSTVIRRDCLPPALRFYGWKSPSLTIGCFQRTAGIDLDYCMKKGIPVVRRPTGGRAILHGRELTYSFSSRPEGHFSGGLHETYRKISRALLMALRSLGIRAGMEEGKAGAYSGSPLCFQARSYGELSAGGRKIAGSAQRRWRDGFLQQGSIPYFIDIAETDMIFGRAAASDEGLSVFPELDDCGFKEAVRAAFEEVFRVELRPAGAEPLEEALALELLSAKYLRPEWNLRR